MMAGEEAIEILDSSEEEEDGLGAAAAPEGGGRTPVEGGPDALRPVLSTGSSSVEIVSDGSADADSGGGPFTRAMQREIQRVLRHRRRPDAVLLWASSSTAMQKTPPHEQPAMAGDAHRQSPGSLGPAEARPCRLTKDLWGGQRSPAHEVSGDAWQRDHAGESSASPKDKKEAPLLPGKAQLSGASGRAEASDSDGLMHVGEDGSVLILNPSATGTVRLTHQAQAESFLAAVDAEILRIRALLGDGAEPSQPEYQTPQETPAASASFGTQRRGLVSSKFKAPGGTTSGAPTSDRRASSPIRAVPKGKRKLGPAETAFRPGTSSRAGAVGAGEEPARKRRLLQPLEFPRRCLHGASGAARPPAAGNAACASKPPGASSSRKSPRGKGRPQEAQGDNSDKSAQSFFMQAPKIEEAADSGQHGTSQEQQPGKTDVPRLVRDLNWEDISGGTEPLPIPCVNEIDEARIPFFRYIRERTYEGLPPNIAKGLTNPDAMVSCYGGADVGSCRRHCAAIDYSEQDRPVLEAWSPIRAKFKRRKRLLDQEPLYCVRPDGLRLLQVSNNVLFECHSGCHGGRPCSNMSLAAGLQLPLQIFRKSQQVGWAVRLLQGTRDVPAGAFVGEFVGEVIADQEADDRKDDYYMFDLDTDNFLEDATADASFSIDARRAGNFTRFINHSCQPNLSVRSVYSDIKDRHFPHVAFFTKKTISAGEELTYDYFGNVKPCDRDTEAKKAEAGSLIPCTCGAAGCRGVFLPAR